MCDTNPDADADPHADAHTEPGTGRSDDSRELPSVLVAKIQDPEDGPAECTLYPRDATGVDLMTTWITAGESDYVTLDEMR